jgi:tetratricopeptide (TPR) repeat protein
MDFHRHIISLFAVMVWSVPAFSQTVELESLIEKSRGAMKESRWEQALDFYNQAVTRYGHQDPLRLFGPQFGAIYFHKGTCEMKLKKWPEAMQSFEICYRDYPNTGVPPNRSNPFQKLALLKWGEAAMGAENWELAVNRFSKFIAERDRSNDTFPQGAFYINNAVCQYKLGHIAEGNENLEIAINNQENFPTPASGVAAGFHALVSMAIKQRNEQVLLDFIGKNRGGLFIGSAGKNGYSQSYLKLAGDAIAAGMQRASLAIYQLVPSLPSVSPGLESPDIIRLPAVALIHEKNGNVRGAFAAYQLLAMCFPNSANREGVLYHLVRTASILGEMEIARSRANEIFANFPSSPHLAEIQAFRTNESVVPTVVANASPVSPAKADPDSKEFRCAMNLYQGRKYQEAKAAFVQIKIRRKSPVSAAFYELECLRKLGDLEGLAHASAIFVKDPSLGGNRLRQLEINALWEDVRTKNWARLEQRAASRAGDNLPGDQRAQVAYCHGLALENLNRPVAALNAYNTAMIADAGASEEVARQAALKVLRLHQADPEVQAAIANWGAPVGNQGSDGNSRLREAAAVAALFELTLGAGTPLPAEFKGFLKYKGGA